MENAISVADLPKVKSLVPGTHVYFTEAIFYRNNGRFEYQGLRNSIVKIISMGIPGEVMVEVVRSYGVNPDPIGIKISKQIGNVVSGYECDECTRDRVFKSGGVLQGIKNGKTVELTSADQGGMAVGSSHADGGIKGDVAGMKKIELEGKEPVLAPGVSSDTRMYDYNGKKMTAMEIASDINVKNGGVKFNLGGQPGTDGNPINFTGKEVIITKPVSTNKEQYDFEGQKMTGLQIVSKLNENNGGVKFA